VFFSYCLWSLGEGKKDVIPRYLEVSSLIANEEDWVQGCGTTIFRISESTANEINRKKLEFFQQAKVARNKQNHYRWQETPIQVADDSIRSLIDQSMPGFGCTKSEIILTYKSLVNDRMGISGSFFAKSSGGQHLMVIPSRQLVIFEYSDQ
jgi:hypothetical protein